MVPVGRVAARFLHTINQAESMISGVLLNLSGLMVQAGAVELALKMPEVGIEKGPQSAGLTSWSVSRRRLLREKRVRLNGFMKKFLGTEMDLSVIIGKQDGDYLAAVARDAKDGYLTDPRVKRWIAQRTEDLLAVIDEQVRRKAALEALKMAMMAEKDLDPLEKTEIIEKFLESSREGRTAWSRGVRHGAQALAGRGVNRKHVPLLASGTARWRSLGSGRDRPRSPGARGI